MHLSQTKLKVQLEGENYFFDLKFNYEYSQNEENELELILGGHYPNSKDHKYLPSSIFKGFIRNIITFENSEEIKSEENSSDLLSHDLNLVKTPDFNDEFC